LERLTAAELSAIGYVDGGSIWKSAGCPSWHRHSISDVIALITELENSVACNAIRPQLDRSDTRRYSYERTPSRHLTASQNTLPVLARE
jgi:hypothetical protein